jgi:hypothetical protein
MAMERVDELLLVSTYQPGKERRASEFSEASQLASAQQALRAPVLSSSHSNFPVLAQAFSYIFSADLVDCEHGTLSPFGGKFLEDSSSTGPDIALIFQYLSADHSSVGYRFETLGLPLNPYRFCRLAHWIVQTVPGVPDTVANDRMTLSELSRIILIRASELCLLQNFRQVRERLLDLLGLEDGEDTAIDAVFEPAFKDSLSSAYQSVDRRNLERGVRDFFRPFLRLDPQEAAFGDACFTSQASPVAFNTHLHQFIPKLESTDDDAAVLESARCRLLFVTRQVSELMRGGLTPFGNGLITIELEAKADLSSHFRVVYGFCGRDHPNEFFANKSQAVFPVWESGSVEISLQLDGKVLKKLILTMGASTQSDRDKVSIRPLQSGDLPFTIRFEFFRFDRAVPLIRDPFPRGWSVDDVFDFAIHGLVLRWLESPDMAPPADLYLFATDVCLRYSISAPRFFQAIALKFMESFCESGSFLDAFVPIVFSCMAAGGQPGFLKRLREFLSTRIPRILMAQLSNPEVIEKSAVTSLLMLLSVFDEQDHIEVFFRDILAKSVTNIVNSVLECLEFNPAPTVPSELVIELYRDAHPREREGPPPTVELVLKSLIRAAEMMLVRCRSIGAFLTRESLPVFANSHSGILARFAKLSYSFASIFAAWDPPPPDQLTFEFLSTYRQLWNLTGSIPENSPVTLFDSVIRRWLCDFARVLIPRLGRTIEVDDFSVLAARRGTSTSILDLFTILKQSFLFIEGLKFSPDEINTDKVNKNVMAYMSLCCSALKDYINELFMLILSGFDRFGLAKRLAFNRRPRKRVLSNSQCFVAMNDLIALRSEWSDFTRKLTDSYGVKMDEFVDPMQGVLNRLRSCFALFGCQLADEVKGLAHEAIYHSKKSLGKTSQELKKNAVAETDDLRILVVDALAAKFREAKAVLLRSYMMRLMVEDLKGVVLGLLESLIPFEDFTARDQFYAIVEAFNGTVKDAFTFFQREADKGDVEYLQEQRLSVEEFQLFDFIRANKEAPPPTLKDLMNEHKDNENKRFLANLMLRQQKKSSGFKRIPGFSFYLN